MKRYLLAPLLAAATFLVHPNAAAERSCEAMASLKIPTITIVSALMSPPICRITAVAKPTSDSHITFELWLPQKSDWNHKFQAVGNGGFIGRISLAAIAEGVKRGYATAGSDTGHGDDESWVKYPEKLKDWSYRAVHEMTMHSKRLIAEFYGEAPKLSYWNGCSTGGKQGLTEAQRYPEDFDAMIVGAPANYITALHANDVRLSNVALQDGMNGPHFVSAEKIGALAGAVLKACDESDRVKDGLISNPRSCNFDTNSLKCKGNDTSDCFTKAQIETANAFYAGAKSKNGKELFPGFEPGSEVSWRISGSGVGLGSFTFKNFVFENPNWDIKTFDIDRDLAIAEEKIGDVVNAIDPNLSKFKSRGGKIVMYHGWADFAISPGNSINYYNSVVTAMGGASKTQDFLRLFMVPGMGHCRGGAGPTQFDALGALEKWREHGEAPSKIIASRSQQGKVDMTRPLCPYPLESVYNGKGNTNDEANFHCAQAK